MQSARQGRILPDGACVVKVVVIAPASHLPSVGCSGTEDTRCSVLTRQHPAKPALTTVDYPPAGLHFRRSAGAVPGWRNPGALRERRSGRNVARSRSTPTSLASKKNLPPLRQVGACGYPHHSRSGRSAWRGQRFCLTWVPYSPDSWRTNASGRCARWKMALENF